MAYRFFILTGLLIAISLKPIILPMLLNSIRMPEDTRIGQIECMSEEELEAVYKDKNVLIVGGTRGTGFGLAQAVAKAGAHVTIVGRNPATGQAAMQELKTMGSGNVVFLQGDIGSVQKAKALMNRLEEHVQNQPDQFGFDFVACTAAVFPRWDRNHQQEDGIDFPFAVMVVGRYILYSNMKRFVKTSPTQPTRVLNIAASGEFPHVLFYKEVATGQRNPKNLFESIMTIGVGNELMLRMLDQQPELHLYTTRVSTCPGMLKTDLHQGQALWFDIVEFLFVKLMGVSIEESGVRHASILASPKLPTGQQSYVSSDMVGRMTSDKLQTLVDQEGQWFQDFLTRVVESHTE